MGFPAQWNPDMDGRLLAGCSRPTPPPICPPRSALEEIAVFALLGPTASCQQMTKLLKHAAHPPVPSFLLMTLEHTRTNLVSFHTN